MKKVGFSLGNTTAGMIVTTRRDFLGMASATALLPGRSLAGQRDFVVFSTFASTRGAGSRSSALAEAAEAAVAHRKILLLDRPVELSQKWSPPPGLILRGDGTENSRIDWAGEGDAIEITGAIDIDGITIDGGLHPTSDRAAGDHSCLVAIHGSLGATPNYLSGIVIGHLRIRRTRSVALVLANLEGLRVGTIELLDIFCNGMIISGVSNSHFENIIANNIGDLKESGHRRGSAVAVFAETKPVSPWYDTGKILKTTGLRFASVHIEKTTDSAFYIHDELKRGVEDIKIRGLRIKTAGKDGFKTRVGPKRVRIGTVEIENASLRGVDIESDDTQIDDLSVSRTGGDAVGEILGRPSAYSGGNAERESIQTHPNGVLVMNCSDVVVRKMAIREVGGNPVTAAEGHGLHLANVTRVTMKGTISGCGGNGLRLAGSRAFSLVLDIDDTCRDGATTSAVLFTADGLGPSFDGSLRASIGQGAHGRARRAIAASAVCNTDFVVDFDQSEFDGRAFDPRQVEAACGEGGANGGRTK